MESGSTLQIVGDKIKGGKYPKVIQIKTSEMGKQDFIRENAIC
jgi:hypothetical protein